MKAYSFAVLVSAVILVVQGVLGFAPLAEEVSRPGHQVFWGVELLWFLREHRGLLARTRSADDLRME